MLRRPYITWTKMFLCFAVSCLIHYVVGPMHQLHRGALNDIVRQ